MIAVSSHKPHAQSGEYRQNQIAAHESWYPVFDEIYYFGPDEPELSDPKTSFVPADNFPWVRDMMAFAGRQRQLVALINADIIVTPRLRTIEIQMDQKAINAGVSKRWNMAPKLDSLDDAQVTDKGLDIFLAKPWLWREVARQCPAGYRIGHCEWDTWTLGTLMRITHRKMADFTESKCIFHPIHEGRDRPFNKEVPKMPESIYDFAKMPGRKLAV